MRIKFTNVNLFQSLEIQGFSFHIARPLKRCAGRPRELLPDSHHCHPPSKEIIWPVI